MPVPDFKGFLTTRREGYVVMARPQHPFADGLPCSNDNWFMLTIFYPTRALAHAAAENLNLPQDYEYAVAAVMSEVLFQPPGDLPTKGDMCSNTNSPASSAMNGGSSSGSSSDGPSASGRASGSTSPTQE